MVLIKELHMLFHAPAPSLSIYLSLLPFLFISLALNDLRAIHGANILK